MTSKKFKHSVSDLTSDLLRMEEELRTDSRTSPEDQLKTPLTNFLRRVGEDFDQPINVVTEHRQSADDVVQGVRLDMAVKRSRGPLIGHLELKAPGKSANPFFKAGWSKHDRKQWQKLQNHPNLIYSNGWEWTLLRHGVDAPLAHVTLFSDATSTVPEEKVQKLQELLTNFLNWKPTTPSSPRSLAQTLAPQAAFLRDTVVDVVTENGLGALDNLYEGWKRELMPGAKPKEFADSFAQTFTYALLLARVESTISADGFSAASLSPALRRNGHKLVGSVLGLMSQETYRATVEGPISILEATIGAVDSQRFTRDSDPWLYFYEDFLSAYDPKMRKDAGVYYTPVGIVQLQVRLVDHVLRTRAGRQRGLASDDVSILDPALGTATYLLSIIDYVLQRSEAPHGDADSLATRIYGFELLMGPYAVAHLRLTQALEIAGANIDEDSLQVYLTNTLTDPGTPDAEPNYQQPLWQIEADLTEEARLASLVKTRSTSIRVIIGNPPYDRGSKAKSVGAGSSAHRNLILEGSGETRPLLDDFTGPLKNVGAGGHAKNLYNSYVYFIRWAIWKACEQNSNQAGIVSFITSSSYLRGPGFAGLREYMRRVFDEVWIIDLGGEGRGARLEENVFNIQTPVAVFVGIQHEKTATGSLKRASDRRKQKAQILYRRVHGSRAEKLHALENIEGLDQTNEWVALPSETWGEKFVPSSSEALSDGIPLEWIFPWTHSGAQFKRKWPIAPTTGALNKRWSHLFMNGTADAQLFSEDRDLTIDSQKTNMFTDERQPLLSSSEAKDSMMQPARYGYRSFDRQWCLPDKRVATYPRQQFWNSISDKQLFMATLTSTSLGAGPALTVSPYVPDMDFFRGSFGAKNMYPLHRTATGPDFNISQTLQTVLASTHGHGASAEDIAAYTMGLLGTGAYTDMFLEELTEEVAHVPFTADPELFSRVAEFGRGLIFEQTWGERFGGLNEYGQPVRQRFKGSARLAKAVPNTSYPDSWSYDATTRTLTVGDGWFENVDPSIMSYEVSGMDVVGSWLGYRMRVPAGRSSSPLGQTQADSWQHDRELLELLWQIEFFVAAEPRGKELLQEVIASDLIAPEKLGPPPAAATKSPKIKKPSDETLDL